MFVGFGFGFGFGFASLGSGSGLGLGLGLGLIYLVCLGSLLLAARSFGYPVVWIGIDGLVGVMVGWIGL